MTEETSAESAGRPASHPAPDMLEATLLGGRPRYTRRELADLSGVSFSLVHRVWRALGFAEVPDDVVAFTDGDLAATRRLAEVLRSGLVDEELALRLARAMGQTMARLAEGQIDAVVDTLAGPSEPLSRDAVPLAMEMVERFAPDFEALLLQVWRRQLAAAGTRVLADDDTELSPTRTTRSVGFADLVSFTELSRKLGEDELADLVESFENTASDVVTEFGGRVVKTLGDEVLFVIQTPQDGAEVAVRLAERFRLDEEVPDVRVGVAYGTTLLRLGDVFGNTVNLASRLTSFARPGTVLADERMADALEDAAAYRVIRIRRRPARGLGVVQPFVLRRER